jgi:hypothetical protein
LRHNFDRILRVVEANRNTAHFKVYQTVRIAKLKVELKQHEANHATQWAAAQQDGPYEKGSHPFKEYFLLVYWLLRSELQLWGSTLPSNEESLQVFVNICESLIGEVNRVLHPILSEDKTAKTNPVVKKVSMSRVLSSRSANLNTVVFPYYTEQTSFDPTGRSGDAERPLRRVQVRQFAKQLHVSFFH